MSKIHYKKCCFLQQKKWGKVSKNNKYIQSAKTKTPSSVFFTEDLLLCFFVKNVSPYETKLFVVFARTSENVEVGATLKWWYWRNAFSPDLVSFWASSWFDAKKSLKYCCCTITAVASICAVQSDHLRCFTALFRELLCSFGWILAMRLAVAFIRKLAFYKKKYLKEA